MSKTRCIVKTLALSCENPHYAGVGLAGTTLAARGNRGDNLDCLKVEPPDPHHIIATGLVGSIQSGGLHQKWTKRRACRCRKPNRASQHNGGDMPIPTDHIQGPPCPFRAVGFSAGAGLYPKSIEALTLMAERMNVPADKLPRGMRNHPNPYMRDWMEALAVRRLNGEEYKHESGRYLLPSEL